MDQLTLLRQKTQQLRQQLLSHSVYAMVTSVANLRTFMEHHVFAVWDFMSLLKRLQQLQTCTTVPWLPKSQTAAARLVNEIVLGEETDEDGRGGYISHFELYREAMLDYGASTAKIDGLVAALSQGSEIEEALRDCAADPCVSAFVRTTWSFVTTSRPHCLAAAFTFGREDVIPDMFRRCVATLAAEPGQNLARMRYYLDRHIELDEASHAPMAIKMIQELCGDDDDRWREAADAVVVALRSRIALWDGIVSCCRVVVASAGASRTAHADH